MGMGALVQLIAKGQQSPITSALQGFQQGAQMMPGIKMAQLAPLLRQAQIQQALAKARADRQPKLTSGQQAINAFQSSLAKDQASGLRAPSSTTMALGAILKKLTASPQGTTVTTTPTGGTQIQLGGTSPATATGMQNQLNLQPQAPQQQVQPGTQQTMQQQVAPTPGTQPTAQPQVQQPPHIAAAKALDDEVAATPHPTLQEQRENVAKNLLFAPGQTPAQATDQKQLGADMKTISTNSQASSDDNLVFARKLRKAIKDATAVEGPVKGLLAWSTPQGQALTSLLAQNVRKMMSLTKGLRTQKEFDQLRLGAGKATFHKSTLNKIADGMLDEAYQRRLKADFYKNYMDKGGKSSLQASQLWANSLSGTSSDKVDDKFLNFNVSGTKRNFKDYVGTIRNLMKKNPNRANTFANIPITSLIREDLE